MLAAAVSATLAAHGLEVIDLDAAATPTVGVQVRHQKAVAGVQITASHNPKEYNGIKLFGSDGRILNKSAGEAVLARYKSADAGWVDVDSIGQLNRLQDAHSPHLRLVLDTIDVDVVRKRRFKVLLDSNHGAGGVLAVCCSRSSTAR